MKNLIGATINQYQIFVKVRETGTRVLFKAYDPRAHQHVGLEIVKVQCVDSSALLNLLKEQARKNARLTHPNIAALIDSGIHDETIYLVYNFYPARPLRRFFNRTYSWGELARELVSITQAVGYAHEAGIIHRALNPNSIILDDKKNPILFDFGFEQIIKDFTLAHSQGAWINKWGYEYCAPEQLNGETPDARSDVYAMGMILHDWMNGEIALLEPTPLDTLRKRIFSQPQDLKPRKEIPPAIRTLVEKCIAVDPAERYQSMQEVGLILARGALDLTITKSMVRKPLSAASPRPAMNRSWMALGLLAVVVLAAGLVWGAGSGFLSSDGSDGSETAIPPIVTQSSTPRPTSTPAATKTSVPPTIAVAVTSNAPAVGITYPLFQETPIVSVDQVIQTDNVNQLVPISVWGIGDMNDLAASPDGRHLAAGTSRGVFVFDPVTLDLQEYIDTYSWVSAVAFSPDSKTIAVGDRDGLVRLWDTDTWQEMTETTYSGHTKGILDLAFSPDGTRLASVGLDNNLFQWEVNSKDASKPAPIPVTSVSSVAYSSDGRYIVTGDGLFKVNIWDAGSTALTRAVTLTSRVVDIASVGDSSLLVVGGGNQTVWLVNVDTGTIAGTVGSLQYPLARIAAASDGKSIAGADVNGGIFVWNIDSALLWKSPALTGGVVPSNPLGSVHSLAFGPDGKTLFSGLRNGTLRAFDASSGQDIRQNQSLDAHVNKFTVSHDSRHLLTQHDNRTVKLWDIWNSRLLYPVQGEIKLDNPFSQDDRYFAIASDPLTVKVFLTAKGDEIHTFNNREKIEAIRFIRNDAQVAAGYDKSIHLWSMASGQEMKTSRDFSGSGCSNYLDWKDALVFSVTSFHHIMEKGQSNSSLCNFQKVDHMRAFYIDDGNGTLAYGGNSLLSVRGAAMEGVNLRNVVSVAVSPSGNLAAAAYDDNTIHLWDVATRQEVMSLYGHSGSITDLRFTPDGRLLISASLDGTIRLWGIPD